MGCAGGHNLQRRVIPDMLRHGVHFERHPRLRRQTQARLALHRAPLPGSGLPANRERGASPPRTPLSKASTRGCAPLSDACIACRATDELLNETLFPSLAHARATLADWRTDYNVARPHSGIGWKTPGEYAASFAPQRGLTLRPMNNSAPAPVVQSAQLGKTETRSLAQVG